MRYDPFAPPSNDPSETGVSATSTGVVISPILSSLQSLPWGTRSKPKRPRGDSHKTRVVERVVEKIVEKVVTVPSERFTILGVPPIVDDRVRNLVNFMLQYVTGPEVEVEAKLGMLFDQVQGVRAIETVPVLCETPINEDGSKRTRFESSVERSFFLHLNNVLNARVEATGGDGLGRVEYVRTRETDYFWPGKVRETRHFVTENGKEVERTIRVQRKTRISDINFMCPISSLDVRYSASAEVEAELPRGPDPRQKRYKERISYKFDCVSVDITAVEMTDPGAGIFERKSSEIEVEIDASANLFGEVDKFNQGDPSSRIFEMAATLINTVRVLQEEVRHVPSMEMEGQQPQNHQGGQAQAYGEGGYGR